MKTTKYLSLILLGLSALIVNAEQNRSPKPISTPIPNLTAKLHNTDEQVDLYVEINASGYVTHAKVEESTNPELNDACLDAIRNWKFKPAIENGKAVAAKIRQPFRFSKNFISTEKKSVANKDPKATRRTAPEVPTHLQHVSGKTVVSISLDDKGHLLEAKTVSSTHEELGSLCTDALKNWKFKPAYKNGNAVASTCYIPFQFTGKSIETKDSIKEVIAAADAKVTPIRQKSPKIPSHLKDEKGETIVHFTVDQFGYVSDPEVASTSNKELSDIAVEAVLAWKYKPAIQDGHAIATRVAQPFRFNGGIVHTQAREVVDTLPKVRRSVSPNLPEQLKDVQGYVHIEFSIDEKGNVVNVHVKDSSLSDLDEPSLLAARQWKFKPGTKQGVPTSSKVMVPFHFSTQG